jgi:hypothetical protein
VNNNANNRNERDRKMAKLAWVVELANNLGFPVVVQRQPDKFVSVEIGDPDAPEMVMALGHLDSPTADYDTAVAAVRSAWQDKGFMLGTIANFSNPTLYLTHDNPLIGASAGSGQGRAVRGHLVQYPDVEYARKHFTVRSRVRGGARPGRRLPSLE